MLATLLDEQSPSSRSLSLSEGREVDARRFDKLSDGMGSATVCDQRSHVTEGASGTGPHTSSSLLAKLLGTTSADRQHHLGP